MNARKQQFRDKDIIFREGDPATRAFTIIAGKVELVTEVDGKEKHLGLLGPGRTLGDQDVSWGRHQATAIAAGTVTLRPLDSQALALVSGAPPRAGLLARLLMPLMRPPTPGRRFSFSGWIRHLRRVSQPTNPTRIEIRFAPIDKKSAEKNETGNGDDGAEDFLVTPAVILEGAFANFPGIRALPLRQKVNVPEPDPDADEAAADQGRKSSDAFKRLHWAVRQALAQAEADLAIIYETVDAANGTNNLRLWFLPLGIQNEDPPGLFEASQSLVVPADLPDPFRQLVAASAIAATVPLTDVKKARLRQALPAIVEQAAPVPEAAEQHPGLSPREKIVARLFLANVLAQMSAPAGQLDGYRLAADIYGQAIDAFTEDSDALDRAVAQRSFGSILPMLAPEWEPIVVPAAGEDGDEERTLSPLDQAAQHLDAAGQVFNRERHPKEWAALQNRLGQVCYRINAQEGDHDLLKKALNHYQAALQVFNRVDHPVRWAEVLNNIGQAAAILGEQIKSVELLEKAIEACSGALEVRKKLEYPMLWAATQNNLGSALFMLARQTHDPAQLDAAREAFSLAKGVYEARGAYRLTMITEKNLKRVLRLFEIARFKDPPPLPWEPRDYNQRVPDEGDEADLPECDDEKEDMSVYELPEDDKDDAEDRAEPAAR
ncbi:MAG: cyclic nucleotide-binding domain-containing protein [Rhodospirillaceae bacterium]